MLIHSFVEHFGEEFLVQAEQLKNPDWSYSDAVAHELGT
jgi:hypothetical protein